MRALYLGEDDPMVGLYHGKHYEIRKETRKSGTIVVIVEDLLGLKLRYKENGRYRYEWMVKR